jgi:starvation-inducible DNA-binding protein
VSASCGRGADVAEIQQKQLSAYNDLHLTLKHVHWNVLGPSFIGVHEMIDPQVLLVRGYADELAERIATLGASPKGTPGAIIEDRTWDDYSLGRDFTDAHGSA